MPKENNPRLLLAKLRSGDFAHAGDIEAIDIVFQKILELIKLDQLKINPGPTSTDTLRALDVGCGPGGTSDYIRKMISWDVVGIDVDHSAINYSKLHYSKVKFFDCDVVNIDKLFGSRSFNVICMFNVFYAFSQPKIALEKLASVAREGCILAIFDYSITKKGGDFDVRDLTDKKMTPICLDDLKIWLQENGWDLIEIVDLNSKYQDWYRYFLKLLSVRKEEILREFTEEAFNKVYTTFSALLNNMDLKKIGGSVVYAKLTPSKDTFFHKEISKDVVHQKMDTTIKCKL